MATQTTPANSFDMKSVHYAIATLLVVGSQFIPQLGPITHMGCGILGTFLGVIYGWTFLGILWPSILGFVGLGLTVGMGEVLVASFANPVVPMVILVFGMLAVLSETNVTNLIAKLFVANRFTKNRPWMFVFFFFLGGLVCAQINVFVAMILLGDILLNLCKKLDIKPFSPFPAVMLIGLALSIQMGQIMLPFMNTALTLVFAYSSMVGEMPNYLLYMAFIIPLNLLMIILYTLVCRFIFRIDVSPLKKIDDNTFGAKEAMTREQKIAIFFLFFLIIMLLGPSLLPKTWALSQIMNKLTMFGAVAIVILIFMLVKNPDGTYFFNFARSAAKGMSWDAVFMTAFILVISGYMTAEGTGIRDLISMVLAPMTNFSPLLFIILTMIFAGVITNFANNVVLAIVILPVVITFTSQMGLEPLGIACILFTVTQLALFTPGASAFAGMAFAHTDWVKAPMMMKYAATAILILIPIFLLVAIPYYYILF